MTPLDRFFSLGETITLGTHVFTADEIKAFARKYDPQPFHLDEEAAARSVFGSLCASGWHTASTWMKYNLKTRQDAEDRRWDGPGPRPEFGPSPGFEKLRWLKPVHVGEPVTFTRKAVAHRALASRPGWRVLTLICGAHDSRGDTMLEFESAVLVKTG